MKRFGSFERESKGLVELLRQGGESVADFFEENLYARKVAEGAASYVEMIKPIKARYATVGSKLWRPKYDPTFDVYTHDVLSSMNQVGIATVDPTIFMTQTRRETIQREELETLGVFGAAGVAELIVAHFREMVRYRPAAEAFFVGAVVLLPFVFLKGHEHYGNMHQEIKQMERGARATDAYLRYVWQNSERNINSP